MFSLVEISCFLFRILKLSRQIYWPVLLKLLKEVELFAFYYIL